MERTLFRWGMNTLSSGRPSLWKLACEVLMEEDWMGIAELSMRLLPAYSQVEGVPTGGDAFARWMIMGQTLVPSDPVLLVDDVGTTFRQMERQRAGRHAIGCVLFARGLVPPWVTALFTAHPGLWEL